MFNQEIQSTVDEKYMAQMLSIIRELQLTNYDEAFKQLEKKFLIPLYVYDKDLLQTSKRNNLVIENILYDSEYDPSCHILEKIMHHYDKETQCFLYLEIIRLGLIKSQKKYEEIDKEITVNMVYDYLLNWHETINLTNIENYLILKEREKLNKTVNSFSEEKLVKKI